MNTFYKSFLLLSVAVCLAGSLQAQRFVLIEASEDPITPTDIFPIIMARKAPWNNTIGVRCVY